MLEMTDYDELNSVFQHFIKKKNYLLVKASEDGALNSKERNLEKFWVIYTFCFLFLDWKVLNSKYRLSQKKLESDFQHQ